MKKKLPIIMLTLVVLLGLSLVFTGSVFSEEQDFNIPPPNEFRTLPDIINALGQWIFNISIPISIIIIIYGGILMLTAGGKPDKFAKGATALKYAVLGLAVILIGKGFVSLIKSFLDANN